MHSTYAHRKFLRTQPELPLVEPGMNNNIRKERDIMG